MSTKPGPGRKKKKRPEGETRLGVTVLRLGLGKEEYALPEGSTLADLLRKAGESLDCHDVMIDGRPLADQILLQSGMIVSIVPKSNGSVATAPWRETIGMFRDDPAFEEMMRDVEAARRAEPEEE